MTNDDADILLISRILAGDGELFGVLESKYSERFAELVYSEMPDPSDMNFIITETFFTAFVRLREFPCDVPFFKWVCRMALDVLDRYGDSLAAIPREYRAPENTLDRKRKKKRERT